MRTGRRLLAAAIGLLLACGGGSAWAGTAQPWLESATTCDPELQSGAVRRAVLLVHGTGATSAEAWGWNYANALRREGYGVCTVELPGRALVDIGLSAEHVAEAARAAYRVSAEPIAIVGHSQGGLLALWVAKFWPDVAAHTGDVITLAAPVNGTALADALCAPRLCTTVAWQLRRNARFIAALARKAYPTEVDFTSIGSLADEVVFPQPAMSTLGSGTTVMVQDVCPLRPVDHGFLLADAVAYDLVLDALRRDGPADPARIGRDTCLQLTMPGVDPVGAIGFASTLVALSLGIATPNSWVGSEPAVPAYAR